MKILEEYKPDEQTCSFTVTSPTDNSRSTFQAESEEDIFLIIIIHYLLLLYCMSSFMVFRDAHVVECHSISKDYY